MKIRNMFSRGSAAAALLLSLAACSSNTEQASDNCEQAAGIWTVQQVIDDTQCGGMGIMEKHSYTVSQVSCQISIAENGAVGQMIGSEVHWPAYSYPINGGTTYIAKSITRVDDDKLTGQSHWTWSNGTQECSGTSEMNGYMNQADGQNTADKNNPLLSPAEGTFEHIFSVNAPNAKQVYLAGEMTDWQPNILKMKKGPDGVWFLPVYLEQGAWQYKFVIDGQWIYDKANPVTTDDGFEGYNSIIILGEEDADSKATANIPHGTVEKVNIQSKALGTNSPFMVYLPPGYSQNSEKNYPVLFLLHGYGNNEGQWTRDGKIHNFMDNYLAQGWIQPFILVMPFGDTSMYVGDYETHILKEVKAYVDSSYRVKTGKASTAVSGMSMGGFGAFYLAHRHQDVFGLSVPLSGYFDMSLYPELGKSEKITMDSELHFYCGEDDTISFASNEALVKRLQKNHVNFTYQTTAGGHTWRYWNGISKDFLKVVSDYFDKS
ncbi:alpha/beta hydrolase-fold protein [Psychromonas aquimarina]|uniref:alpha/beta hydrolase-fold protein n=1 Tax=Psychromonas aquimarina TaxID=444919 RepID=UPI00041DC776|nr:alpha/beta hydrolase-fold protein [Psychromonas aquimarina]